ncbi:MAG TPA: hypothetical protein VGI40_02885 [Pirellulaceae bacterium]|jgi:hypothetical protein
MQHSISLPADRQFSLAYLLAEIALVAIALAAARVALLLGVAWIEVRAVLFCVALTAGCGALGGMCFRMAVGLVGGGIFSVSSIPLLWIALSSASR